MPRYSIVFLDADQTLFDFHAAEKQALCRVMTQFQLSPTEENIRYYSETNRGLWREFDLGKIDQTALGRERFARLLAHLGQDAKKGAEMNSAYECALGDYAILLPGALPLCQRLAPYCRLFILTNGMTRSQTGRLEKSTIKPYIEKMYVSQAMGCRKPEKAYFEKVFADLKLTPTQKKEAVMVGDSLGSDIQGGMNAGLDTIWYQPDALIRPDPLRPTWTARSLEEIGQIILDAPSA